ncbi:30S ribosomal protein S9 [Fibrobacterota bacterium]
MFRATGRRKAAIARIILKPGTGKRKVNGRGFEKYFPGATINMIINQPFTTLECNDLWDVTANVNGGGLSGQAEAIKLGIARALVLSDEKNRKPLRAGGFLTRDPRVVQRKMYGRAKARKRYQFSKR